MEFSVAVPHMHERVIANSGSRMKREFKPVFDEDGHFELEETESSNLYDYIQSFRESCDLKAILTRFLNGDEQAVNRRVPLYIDTTEMPDNARDWLNLSLEAQAEFNSLSPEVKKNFNNSFEEYLLSIAKPGFAEKLGYVSESAAPVASDQSESVGDSDVEK